MVFDVVQVLVAFCYAAADIEACTRFVALIFIFYAMRSEQDMFAKLVEDLTDVESGKGTGWSGDRRTSDTKNPLVAADAPRSDTAELAAPMVDAQAKADAAFEEWVVASRLAPIRAQLVSLGVADKTDLADLDTADLHDLRSGLTKIGQKKFDRDLESLEISLDAMVPTNNANPLGLDRATMGLVDSVAVAAKTKAVQQAEL